MPSLDDQLRDGEATAIGHDMLNPEGGGIILAPPPGCKSTRRRANGLFPGCRIQAGYGNDAPAPSGLTLVQKYAHQTQTGGKETDSNADSRGVDWGDVLYRKYASLTHPFV
ncbi:hypothetical protein [Novosphingobium humi]|uniref:hypothetical protein n=1 Tax=Novosphingobium humi TaxID=2282397 RepID=UPI0025AFE4A8|nr:hypothetical protein [Novosphingobium humi]WJT01114.1 hypothetical protein NYQ05_20755 [Novosphingobium humi]